MQNTNLKGIYTHAISNINVLMYLQHHTMQHTLVCGNHRTSNLSNGTERSCAQITFHSALFNISFPYFWFNIITYMFTAHSMQRCRLVCWVDTKSSCKATSSSVVAVISKRGPQLALFSCMSANIRSMATISTGYTY